MKFCTKKQIVILYFLSLLPAMLYAAGKLTDERMTVAPRDIEESGYKSGGSRHSISDTRQSSLTAGDTISEQEPEQSISADLLHLLQRTVFRDTTGRSFNYTERFKKSEELFKPFSGLLIADIYIENIPVFGGSIYDTTVYRLTRPEKSGNAIHTNTKEKVIYNNLLFKKGDKINPFQLADNERLLRSLSFIKDAKIIVLHRMYSR
jgi:hypothetical protein